MTQHLHGTITQIYKTIISWYRLFLFMQLVDNVLHLNKMKKYSST